MSLVCFHHTTSTSTSFPTPTSTSLWKAWYTASKPCFTFTVCSPPPPTLAPSYRFPSLALLLIMSILQSFSTHKVELDGNSVMLGSGYIDSDVARQLSTYIKHDRSLCRYLHVFHQKPTPHIDGGEARTWFVDGELVEIKDWLVDNCKGLIHYPFPPLKLWPDHNYYKKLLAWGFQFPSLDDNKVRWRHHNGNFALFDTFLEFPEAKSEILSAAFEDLNLDLKLDQLYSPQSSVSSNDFATMASRGTHGNSFGPQPPSENFSRLEDLADHLNVTADGTVDRFIKKRVAVPDERDTMAVFVHAGAGYHSLQNEHIHLTMCAK